MWNKHVYILNWNLQHTAIPNTPAWVVDVNVAWYCHSKQLRQNPVRHTIRSKMGKFRSLSDWLLIDLIQLSHWPRKENTTENIRN